jgi:hypothetical protein
MRRQSERKTLDSRPVGPPPLSQRFQPGITPELNNGFSSPSAKRLRTVPYPHAHLCRDFSDARALSA